MTSLPFSIGTTYHRVEDIHDQYGGNRYSGISPCAEHPYVFIFFGESGEWHGYDDEILNDGRFLYTGEGRDGDMTMEGGNAAIKNHKENGDELHAFELNDGAWEVTYVGQYEYTDHYWTRLPDRNDKMRDAIRFELVPAGGLETAIRNGSLSDLSTDELYDLAEQSVKAESTTQATPTSGTTYRRSEIVKQYALRVADGVCQGCGKDAPFTDANGDPFLEVHHLHRRSDGGADHPDNVIALCPNCHRRVHHGQNGEEYNQTLIAESEAGARI
jgi:5-methylcytosine-specific restriction protein A